MSHAVKNISEADGYITTTIETSTYLATLTSVHRIENSVLLYLSDKITLRVEKGALPNFLSHYLKMTLYCVAD